MSNWYIERDTIKKAINSVLAPNPWYYKLKKEVREKVAIDYREEWYKFKEYYRERQTTADGKYLGDLMHNLINAVEEYVKTGVRTEIEGGDKNCHIVALIVRGEYRGTIRVGKDAFRDWLKNRKEVK